MAAPNGLVLFIIYACVIYKNVESLANTPPPDLPDVHYFTVIPTKFINDNAFTIIPPPDDFAELLSNTEPTIVTFA